MLIRIFASCVFFTASYFVPENLKLYGFLLSYIVIGSDVVYSAVRNIFRGNLFDENFLMALATVGAFFIGNYPEGVAVMLFYQIGELFQNYALDKSRKSISELMDIRPEIANLQRGTEIVAVSPEEVTIGDIIVVKPGEKVPLDGIIISGNASIDTSAISGESVPREVGKSDFIMSGCINLNGLLKVEVTNTYSESTASKIIELVENSAFRKAKSEKFITKFARYYTPIVVICAVLTALIPPIFFNCDWSEQLRRALIFLVVSCPCALVVSIPLTFFGAIGGASRKGILIKGSEYIDKISKVNTVAFDKTGTLTKGEFQVNKIVTNNISRAELCQLAAYAEYYNDHPIAQSLKKVFNSEPDLSRIGETTVLHGGIMTRVDGKGVYVGNGKLMEECGIKYFFSNEDGAIIYVALENEFKGYFVISDAPKDTSKKAIAELKAIGVNKTAILTGDISSVADKIGKALGADEVYSELLPQNKVEIVEKLSNEGILIFVGDGINDAPVLACSDVGVSMGMNGAAAAIEASDAVIMTDDPLKICELITLSRKAIRIVKQNIYFALLIKFAVLIFGAMGHANMWEAVFADVGVSVIAILNSMRMLKK